MLSISYSIQLIVSAICPQADVICTCSALDVAKPRWLVMLSPEGGVSQLIVNIFCHGGAHCSAGNRRGLNRRRGRGILATARGAHSPSAITRMTFGVMDIERRAIPYLSYAYPIVRFQSSSNEVPMRFQW